MAWKPLFVAQSKRGEKNRNPQYFCVNSDRPMHLFPYERAGRGGEASEGEVMYSRSYTKTPFSGAERDFGGKGVKSTR